MADEKDAGGSSALESIGNRWNKLFGWAMKKKADEQSVISEKRLPIGVNWSTEERVLYDWIPKDSSGEESEPEVNKFDQLVRPGHVKEKMLQMLGVGSSGSKSDSEGSGGSVKDFGIETNIEGLLDGLCDAVGRESCAADLLEGVAEMFKEGDEEEESSMNSNPSESESESASMHLGCFKEWISNFMAWLAGRCLFSVLGKVGWCANVLLHYYLKSF